MRHCDSFQQPFSFSPNKGEKRSKRDLLDMKLNLESLFSLSAVYMWNFNHPVVMFCSTKENKVLDIDYVAVDCGEIFSLVF